MSISVVEEAQGSLLTTHAAEHHVLYQYNIAGAGAHYMGLIQTETVCHLVNDYARPTLILFTHLAVFPTRPGASLAVLHREQLQRPEFPIRPNRSLGSEHTVLQ